MEHENWVPGRIGWAEFCKANPALGLKGSDASWLWFVRMHSDKMLAAGVLRRARSRSFLLNRDTFGAVAFDYFSGVTE